MRVTECDTEQALGPASSLFEEYRRHYGQRSGDDHRTQEWLTGMVRSGMLIVYTAAMGSSRPIGLALAHPVPASLTLGQYWELRDLFVVPGARRQGVGAALVEAVRDAARAAGARRLRLVTEVDNHAALDLYTRLGFRRIEGFASLNLDLTQRP